jgi:ATP diphosphatase
VVSANEKLSELLAIMAKLRDPQLGCPWDRIQDFKSIAPYTIEEAYEVADAISRNDLNALKDELGDLLFQVVFHARMAEEQGAFAFADVIDAINDKMTRRHPHVFAGASIADAQAQTKAWEAMKRAERGGLDQSVLAGIGTGIPEMTRSLKLTKRAATVGFDWPEPAPVLEKLKEEIGEFQQALAEADAEHAEEEYGDMLFVLVNLARHYRIDPGHALRRANEKFERRFRGMEALCQARGMALEALSLTEQDHLWDEVKANERSQEPSSAP